MPTTPLRIGVLGTGGIARAFVTSLQGAEGVEVVAVASRTPANAEQFAQKFGLPGAHEGYAALLQNPGVDAVYNALPNSLHAHWTIEAAGARKHILCEKPLGVNLNEARAMFVAAEEHQVLLLEAFPYMFQPETLRAVQLCQDGTIGALELIQASFGFSVKNADNIRLSAELAGGALMDVGCYAVSFARMVVGTCPVRVNAVARWGNSGVDLSLMGTLEYPGGVIAQIACSLTSGFYRRAAVLGSGGVIETDFFNHASQSDLGLRLRKGAGGAARFEDLAFEGGDGFVLESQAFARQTRQPDALFLAAMKKQSLDNAATIEALLSSARQGKPAPVVQP